MFLENIRSRHAAASQYVHCLDERAGSVLILNTVKHEQMKKDKSGRFLKELESGAGDAVSLAHHIQLPFTNAEAVDPGKKPRGAGSLGRSVVTPAYSYRTAEPIFYRDDILQQFALDYAANEDKIRKLHEELEQETQRLHVHILTISTSPTDLAGAQAHVEEKIVTTLRRDKWREKNYIKGLTLTRKSCEGRSFHFSMFSQLGPDLTPVFRRFPTFGSEI